MNRPETITHERVPFYLTVTIVILSFTLWFCGLMNSVIVNPERHSEKNYRILSMGEKGAHSPDLQKQHMLSLAYWKRYRDIKKDPYFGENGPNGILGGREHYKQHGKYEGRVYGPLPVIENMKLEKILADAYWQRYPDVAASAVWGQNGSLGVLGPRDHYRYVGKYQGRTWGIKRDRQVQSVTPQSAN